MSHLGSEDVPLDPPARIQAPDATLPSSGFSRGADYAAMDLEMTSMMDSFASHREPGQLDH